MKKSIFLFILWAVISVVLTCIYLMLMMFDRNSQFEIVGWIICLCTAGVTLGTMPVIRTQAKAEQITWLVVLSKVLLIACSIWGAIGLVFFLLSRLFVS